METPTEPRQARKQSEASTSDLADILWRAADKLRGSMDAAEYKHFVLGLIFLKYVSDAFEERYGQLGASTEVEPDPSASRGGVISVPSAARWSTLTRHATLAQQASTTPHAAPPHAAPPHTAPPHAPLAGERSGIAHLLDGATLAICEANPALRNALQQGLYTGRGVDERRLCELVCLIDRLDFYDRAAQRGSLGAARDVLGEVYEYCLERFAIAEGRRGGEYYTPKSIVKLIVEVLEPQPGERVYDPACGSGGMFVQAEKFIESHGGRSCDISVYGQELNRTTWRLSKMNLAVHDIEADLGNRWADSFHDDLHPDLSADIVMANPPFNISDWGGERLAGDPRWKYGVPPVGNANFAWLQHLASKLSPKGRAGIVLANGSMSSQQSGEGDIRRAMIEDDLISCMIALPGQLFRSTQIPACLWFFERDKGWHSSSHDASRRTSHDAPRGTDRRHEVLFIDARSLGVMVGRTERILTEAEIRRIGETYRAWRGTRVAPGSDPCSPGAHRSGVDTTTRTYADVPGFCASVTLSDIREHGYLLTPGRFVGAALGEPDDRTAIDGRIAQLTKELVARLDEAARLDAIVRDQLDRLA